MIIISLADTSTNIFFIIFSLYMFASIFIVNILNYSLSLDYE